MARSGKSRGQQESAVSRLTHIVPLLIAAFLLARRMFPCPLNERFVPAPFGLCRLGAALTLGRPRLRHLGSVVIAGNWSSYVSSSTTMS